jgi:hypothetical protein
MADSANSVTMSKKNLRSTHHTSPHSNSPSLAQSTLWEFLSQDDVTYLLNTLPKLENPLSLPLSKVVDCLKSHSLAFPPSEVVAAHDMVNPHTSSLANGTSRSAVGHVEHSVTVQRKQTLSQRERDEEKEKSKSRKGGGQKKLITGTARGDHPPKITDHPRTHQELNPVLVSDAQSQFLAEKTPAKKRKVDRGEDPLWTTNASPPLLTTPVRTLVTRLCTIDQDIECATFTKILLELVQPTASQLRDMQSVSGSACLKRCEAAEQASSVHDFFHMVTLIQAAFWIER